MSEKTPLNGSNEHRVSLYGTADDAKKERQQEDLSAIPMYLYFSHFLSAFDDRLWQFAVPVLLMNIWGGTLFPSATIAFVTNALTILVMPYVGAWCDHADRLKTMRFSIYGESVSIVIAAVILCLVSQHGSKQAVPVWDTYQIFLFSLLCLANASAEITMRIGQQSLEKDWAVVVCKEINATTTAINTNMRTIDLSCKLVGPATFGIFVQLVGSSSTSKIFYAAIVISLWNIFAVPLEYYTVRHVYEKIPRLQVRKIDSEKAPVSPVEVLVKGWSAYFNHPIFLASFAYGLLWFTVLDNGILMTAYLRWEQIPEGPLGLSRGAGAIVGIIGAQLYPFFLRYARTVGNLGVWSVWLFWFLVSPILPVFLLWGNGIEAALVMIVCVTLSRAMLWTFDLTIQRLLQEMVDEEARNVISSVHTAITQVMLLCSAASGMIFNRPQDFIVLVMLSLAAVLAAAVLFTYWARRERRVLDGITDNV